MAKGSGRLLTLIGALALIAFLAAPGGLAHRTGSIMPPPCATPGSRLLVESRSMLAAVDPATGVETSLPVTEPRRVVGLGSSGVALVENAADEWALVPVIGGGAVPIPDGVATALLLGSAFRSSSPRWIVERQPDPNATLVRVIDRSTRRVVLETSFPRRIELSASASSPDGRYFAHVQANNVASEVVIFDAMTRARRMVSLPHNGRLAAFAISLTFSPDASCIAISMEREGQGEAETWLVDLTARVPVPDTVDAGYVLAWLPGRVRPQPYVCGTGTIDVVRRP